MNEEWFSVTLAGALLLLDIAIRVAALIFVPINRKPQAATAWLLAIFLIPYVGVILFLLLVVITLLQQRWFSRRITYDMS